jgi:hypothetical protein
VPRAMARSRLYTNQSDASTTGVVFYPFIHRLNFILRWLNQRLVMCWHRSWVKDENAEESRRMRENIRNNRSVERKRTSETSVCRSVCVCVCERGCCICTAHTNTLRGGRMEMICR